MGAKNHDLFLTIRSEGAILPPDLLQRVVAGDRDLGGLGADDYHLPKGEKINEATSRAWNRLLGVWAAFRAAIEKLAETDPATTATRERWLQPFFQELGYGRLLTARPIEVEGKSYAISHGWSRTPIHLVGCHVDLDRSAQRVTGASRSSPHSLLQETLNRSPHHLWGFVTNGFQLRILRNNASLTRQAFVEFDLEAMMLGENYADYVLLWLLCHQSRVEAENPNDCWLEKWSQASKERGVRALDHLRRGVESAITALGRGFLNCPPNRELRDRLRNGGLDSQDYYRQLLRLVYRLLFLFSAEDRGLLLLPGDDRESARARFLSYYSTARLRRLAERRSGTRHTDLFAALRLIMTKLGTNTGCSELALPALGSFLFSAQALPDLESCDIANFDLCEAVRALALTVSNGVRRPVDYKNLGAEELGSVYESLLELHPQVNVDAATFELKVAGGSERKTTGSYYTPTSLIDCLLDSALDPILHEASRKREPERAILELKLVDPACGSGHFLIAAAHRVAKRLASARTGDEEPAPDFIRRALRDVIGHCIYGVDINPMAVELCKVNLWMEALEPGRPLSFLEHHIQCGNALLGATPALLNGGIPDAAFTPLEGDNREACTKWKKVNKAERASRAKKQARFDFDAPWMKLGKIAEGILAVDNLDDESIERIHEKERLYEQTIRSGDYLDGRFLADAWCGAFVWKKDSITEYPITEDIFRQIEQNPTAFNHDKRQMAEEVQRLAREYQFVHWHLNFPGVFRPSPKAEEADNKVTGWNGGFDVVLGNPPWERVKLQEKEWFAARRPDITAAPNTAARGRMIAALEAEDPSLLAAFRGDLRRADGESCLLRNSGRFPLCGKGDINTYAVFAETNRLLLGRSGRVGCIVPSGIATDNTTKEFFADLIRTNTLVSLYDFENAVGLFEGVGHGRFKFCLLTLAGSSRPATSTADFFFFAHHTTDLEDQNRHFTLSAEDIELLNPNTRTCPIFRSKRDAEITKSIYRKVPVLSKDGPPEQNPWKIRFQRMFDMSNDSHLFRTPVQLETQGFQLQGNIFQGMGEKYLPLYEAKMMYYFTHRYGDYAMRPEGSLDSELPRIPSTRLQDPEYAILPKYWLPEWEVIKAISDVPRLVVQAVEAKSEDQACQILSAWFAGYAFAVGRQEAGNTILIRNVLSVWDSMDAALQKRFAAMMLHEEHPLDESDFFWDQPDTTFLDAAQALIRKRTPKWLIGFRDICRATDERTAIFCVLPPVGVGHKAPLIYIRNERHAFFVGAASSYVFDYVTRQNIGGTSLGYFILKQLPVPAPECVTDEHSEFALSRVLELVYTSWDIQGYANALGYRGKPFRWDDDRRFLLRCELDAFYFHLYGIAPDDADYIMGTFPITRRKEEQQYGEYRTKRVILEIYNDMAEAQRTGTVYQTRLDPPPADPRVAHVAKEQPVAVPPLRISVADLTHFPAAAWATPDLVAADNLALFALIDVVRAFNGAAKPSDIRAAAILVRNPAMALAFLEQPQAREWVRVIGAEARPLPANVVSIAQFQNNAIDLPWSDAMARLAGTRALQAGTDRWVAAANFPMSSGQDWVAGRAAIAVELVSTVLAAQFSDRLTAFLRSVGDGTAIRAVS